MKILALTPVNYSKKQSSMMNSNPVLINQSTGFDTVSFKSVKQKTAEKAGNKIVNEFLENMGGELGKKVKEIMSDKESRPIFMTMLVSLAATATELILKDKSKIKTEETEVEEKENPEKLTEEEDNNNKVKKTGRKSIVDKMGKEAFIAKLQEMTDKGYTYAQMSPELDNISTNTIKKYIKDFGIVPQETSAAQQSSNPVPPKAADDKLNDFINAKKYRSEYIKKLEEYPALLNQYKNALKNSAENPKDKYNTDVLTGMEKIFNNLFDLKQKHNKPYLTKFNTAYGDNFDKVSIILNNIPPYKTLQESLAEFRNNDYSAELINKWVNYPAFMPEELNMVEELPAVNRQAIYNLKKEKAFSFELIKNEKYHNYSFKMNFAEDMELTDKLKIISAFHEALYDNIYLCKDKKNIYPRAFDIQEELLHLLKKDKSLDSVYNLLKFIAPKQTEEIGYQPDNNIFTNESENADIEIRREMEKIIRNLDIKNNANLAELETVMNDSDNIFRDLIANNHAKLRFISRFVLNKKIRKDNLYDSCYYEAAKLEKQIDKKLRSGCLVFPYVMNGSSAPSFYLDKCSLGNFIKITLNNNGQIHTIYEDTKKKNYYK